MSKKMLIDAAHPEEVRVAVMSQNKIEDFDFESASKRPLRGNIFLARVTRVEPSLQAAFVDYGGNRHGFLAFSEIHPDYYQIPVSDRQALQAAEKEVAELAAELELAQRGDDEDDEDGNDHHSSDDSDTPETAEANNDEDGDLASDEDDQPIEKRREEEEEEEEADEDLDVDDDNHEEEPVSEASSEIIRKEEKDVEQPEIDDEETHQTADMDEPPSDGESDVETEDDAEEESASENEDSAKSERARRQELFEQYKNAKRKRAHLLRNYKIQEVIKRRQILLIQVVKEERGNKGAALTTYLSLAGRYCVLMPNTARGGGISRKIANGSDRRRLRRAVDSLDVPQGMGLIIRTAGAKRTKTEIKRDYDYLLRMWENIRSLTLKSIAPCQIYEEASLIKRAIRDLYDKDISKVYVEGEEGYREAKDFMKMLMPSHAKNVQPYKDRAPIFLKHGVETQLDGMYQPTVRLKSGGYLVIHQTEALVAIDVNSGRATRERNIEQTALKTNVEAAEEAARQFRLRDLAGLIVIDFIDMEEPRNNRKVEKALKEAMKTDRARVQIGRISPFGLLELSRQRRRSGIVDGTTQSCPTCSGAGVIRSDNMAALRILRAVEGEAISGKVGLISVRASTDVALHVLNHNRDWIHRIEQNNGVSIEIVADPDKHGDDYELEKSGAPKERADTRQIVRADQSDPVQIDEPEEEETSGDAKRDDDSEQQAQSDDKPKRRRRRRRSRRDRDEDDSSGDTSKEASSDDGEEEENKDASAETDENAEREDKPKKRRRRGRRGGRRNRRDSSENENADEKRAQDGDASDSDTEKVSEEAPRAADDKSPEPDEQPQPDKVERTADATREDKNEPDDETEASVKNGASPADAKESETPSATDEQPPVEKKKSTRRGWWQRSAS